MSHTRPWYWPVLGLAAFLAILFATTAGAQDGDGRPSAREEQLLTDFLILAVKPEGDDQDYKLVEIGKAKLDAATLDTVIKKKPRDFLGLGLGLGGSDDERSYNPAAEAAQCRAACAANSQCRSFAYVPPNARQQLGVCHLKTLVDATLGAMTPVPNPDEKTQSPREPDTGYTKDPPIRETAPIEIPPRETQVIETPTVETAPPKPERPRAETPPPPRLPPITVEPFPMPPRMIAEAPPRNIFSPTANIEPPPPLPVRIDEPIVVTTSEEAPVRPRKPFPLWLALVSIAFMLGGATLYSHSHRKRLRTRVSTRLVSNGLDRHSLGVQTSAQPDIGLRFVVRQSAAVGAPGTRIDLFPSGALA
ncbi:MAG: hypothetical protein K8S25_17260 [Alphaproteobacteria bacterium]|nr:hypothetical protein [Alphaproteobacteria bacterium]